MQVLMVNLLFFLNFCINFSTATHEFSIGFYHATCPSAEAIVRKVVSKAVKQDPGLGAGLIRLHFHDCFVRGCDASILLDSTLTNPSEKESPANAPNLRGFEVIDEVKANLEFNCPGTVSCADILAFAAPDSIQELGRVYYNVPSGRKDGLVSLKNEPTINLPSPNSTFIELEQIFATKGLSLQDMVALSGAHSIGVTHCSLFSHRLNTFNTTHLQDPSLNLIFASKMRNKCSLSGDVKVPLDGQTPSRLDNSYYRNLMHGRGLLGTDQALMDNPWSKTMVTNFARYGRVWMPKFIDAMTRMGSIEVLSGSQGEIRRNCRVVNL